MTAPTATGIATEWTPAASSARPAHVPTNTLLTTATIPGAVSVSCHAPGDATVAAGEVLDRGLNQTQERHRAGGVQVEVLGGRERDCGSEARAEGVCQWSAHVTRTHSPFGMATRGQRSEPNAARTSVAKSSGSSQAAKWPPRSTALKYPWLG
jgi:hypothetical protein